MILYRPYIHPVNPLYETLGFASGILGLSVALPQLYRVLKAKTHEGVSLTTWLISLANFITWAVYGLRFNSISQLITNVLAALFTAILIYVLIKQSRNTPLALLTLLTLTSFFTLLGYYTPIWFLTIVLFAGVILGRVPQIIESRNYYRNNETTIVSKTTYTLMIISSIGWILYGILTGLWHNIIASSFGLITSFIVLYYETRKRQPKITPTIPS